MFRRPWCAADQWVSAGVLAAAHVAQDGVQIKFEAPCKLLAGVADFLNDRVLPHGAHSDNNSSGVQIKGGAAPAASHMDSIRIRRAALARWEQFQVSR